MSQRLFACLLAFCLLLLASAASGQEVARLKPGKYLLEVSRDGQISFRALPGESLIIEPDLGGDIGSDPPSPGDPIMEASRRSYAALEAEDKQQMGVLTAGIFTAVAKSLRDERVTLAQANRAAWDGVELLWGKSADVWKKGWKEPVVAALSKQTAPSSRKELARQYDAIAAGLPQGLNLDLLKPLMLFLIKTIEDENPQLALLLRIVLELD